MFSIYKIIFSQTEKIQFLVFHFGCSLLISFSCLVSLEIILSIILNRSVNNKNPNLVPHLNGVYFYVDFFFIC